MTNETSPCLSRGSGKIPLGCRKYLPHHIEIDKELEENNFILKKEGFFKPFIVLVLRYKKIEKD